MPNLTTREVAERLDLPFSTVKNWVSQLPIPHEVDGHGHRRFTPETLEVFQAIRELREEDRSYHTIRRVIGPSQAEDTPTPEPQAQAAPGLTEERVVALITQANAGLSSHVQGLQAEVSRLVSGLAQAQQVAGLLDEKRALAADNRALAERIQAQERELIQLRAQLARPWWKRW